MAIFDELTRAMTAASSVERSVELLVNELAARIKATSNDQNIQRLAHELKATAPAFVRAIAGKPATTD